MFAPPQITARLPITSFYQRRFQEKNKDWRFERVADGDKYGVPHIG